jgi:hypothetical protein
MLQTVSHQVNFFVTRTTNRFDDGPQVQEVGGWPVRAGLHLVGTATRQVTYRDGEEVQDTQAQTVAVPAAQQEQGMTSWGEFGPALAVILTDAAKGQVTWSHWEETPAGPAAVFHYSVPRAASHYAVTYCCIAAPTVAPRKLGGNGNRGRGESSPLAQGDASNHTFSETSGYHGSLAIDPATGAVLRITLEAELSSGDPLLRAATVVEYGLVTVGERQFFSPIRSLAFSMEELHAGVSGGNTIFGASDSHDAAWANTSSRVDRTPILLLNETSFTQYHRLGTTARILAVGAMPGPVNSALANPESASPGTASADTDSVVANATLSAFTSGIAPNPLAVASASASEPVISEISLTDANGLPDQQVASLQERPGFSLKVTSRLVDVGLVAYDKKGHPIIDLKQEEVEVYDNGHKQEVRFFSQSAPPVENSAPPRLLLNPLWARASQTALQTQPHLPQKPAQPSC